MQTITRIFTFDSGHRVMNESFKCFNLHGHTYKVEAEWLFGDTEAIGYAVDFKEIKRIFGQFIEDYIDHAFIANPMDSTYIKACKEEGSKLWLMSLNGDKYCNPTAENIAKELYMIASVLVYDKKNQLRCLSVKLWETPNCFVTIKNNSPESSVFSSTIKQAEGKNFFAVRGEMIERYMDIKGERVYDDRRK